MKKNNDNKRNKKLTVYELTKCAMFVALLAICSWITVPSVIPFTMQTFAVFTMCAVLGTKLSVITVTVYIVLGAIGLPVFSGFRGGVGVLIGATGGYIWGFLLTALACGALIDLQKKCGKESKIFTVLSMLVGLILCYASGTLWYYHVYTSKSGSTTLWAILCAAVFPYIIPDIIKILLAVLTSGQLKKLDSNIKNKF